MATLQQAAYLADEFVLTHKPVFVKHEPFNHDELKTSSDVPVTQAPVPQVAGTTEKLCFFCYKPGHVVADCQSLKRKQQVSVLSKPKGVGLIKTVSLVGPNNVSSGPDECFKPFIFQACVSLTGRAEDQCPVTVLRATACSQSLILSKILPLSAMSACNMSAVVRGTEMRSMPSPLHSVHIMSGLATGFFPVAVRPSFPPDSVHFIMGNDVAGSKVFPVLEVVSPIHRAHYDCRAKHHPGVLVAKALTRAPSPRWTHTAPNSW